MFTVCFCPRIYEAILTKSGDWYDGCFNLAGRTAAVAAQKHKFELGDNEVVGVNGSNRLYRSVCTSMLMYFHLEV